MALHLLSPAHGASGEVALLGPRATEYRWLALDLSNQLAIVFSHAEHDEHYLDSVS